MKQALYKETYINKIILHKSLLTNSYSKSLIRFSKKRKLTYVLDNYNSIHTNVSKRKPLKIGYKTKYGLKKNNRSKCYSVLIPSNVIVEYDLSYVFTVLFGLNLIPINTIESPILLNCLLLKPHRYAFKAYCLGILGIISKQKFLGNQNVSLKGKSSKAPKARYLNPAISPFVRLANLIQNVFCIQRIGVYGVRLNLKFKHRKSKYKKKFWLLPKRKPFYCFKASFKTKSLQLNSIPLKFFFKRYSKKYYRKALGGSKRRKRRLSSVKYRYNLSNKKFKKRLLKWKIKNLI